MHTDNKPNANRRVASTVSLFDHTSGASPTPPATADSATRSQWLTRDAAARLAVRNHLPLAERAHFGQHKTAKALYDTLVAHYSSNATAALGRLLLPYLFPELSDFGTVEDLVTHLRTSDARYRSALPAEFLDRNLPPTYITLYFIVTRLPDSLRAVKDHFLALVPTDLTVNLLEQHLLAAETSVVVVGAACGTPRTPFFEGCSPSPLAPSYASVVAVDILGGADVGAASALSGKRRSSKGKGGRSGGCGSGGGSGAAVDVVEVAEVVAAVGVVARLGALVAVVVAAVGVAVVAAMGVLAVGLELFRGERGASRGSDCCPYVIRTGDRAGQTCAKPHSQHRCFSRIGEAWRAEFGDEAECPRWAELLRYGVDIFALDYDAIPAAMYALAISAEGVCYLCVPPDPGKEAAALGASESALPATAPAKALHTFTLDSGTSRCVRVRSGRTPLLVSPLVAPDSSVAPPPWSSLPATSSWHALPPPCFWSSQVSTFPPALTCLAQPSLRRGAAARRSSLLLVSPDDCSPPDSPHGSVGPKKDEDLPVLHLHSDKGGEFSSDLLREFSHGEGILPASPQQNGIAERRIGLVMEVARTSMFHAAAPHFLWLFAVRYAAHQLNLWPRVSLPDTLPTLRWTRKVGDTSVDKLSARAIPCVFLCFPPDALGWQFYHPTSRRVLPSQDVTFDKLVPFYRLFPYRSDPLPPLPLFLAPGPPPVYPLPVRERSRVRIPVYAHVGRCRCAFAWGVMGAQTRYKNKPFYPNGLVVGILILPPHGPAPSGVSQVDPLPGTVPVEVAVDSGAARGTASWSATSEGAEPGSAEPRGAEPDCAEPEGAEPGGAEPWGAEPKGVELGGPEPEVAEPRGAESEGAGSGGSEPRGIASSGGPTGASPRLSPRPEPLSPQQLREWFAQCTRLRSGAAGAGDSAAVGTRAGGAGATSLGGAGVPAGAGGTGGAVAAGPGGVRTRGTRAARAGSIGGAGAGGTGASGAGTGEAGAGDPGTRGARAGGTCARGAGAGGT
ncbi:unnamed protein product [Closterium sp. NIES-53]